MHPPTLVREPSAEERARLEAAPRAAEAFTVRRAGRAPERRRASPEGIARGPRCATRTVRGGIRAFDAAGLAAPTAGSPRPGSAAPVPGGAVRRRPRAILRRPPRAFGHARSTRTLALLAREAHGRGPGPTVLAVETIRRALPRPGVGRRRAERRPTSPDPAYAQRNAGATG